MRYLKDKNKQFTLVLKNLRKEKKLTQEELAYKAGINEKYFGRIERGESSPTFKTIVKICSAIDIKISKFMALVELENKKK